MIKIWLLLSIFSYFSYSISTTIDKILLNNRFEPLTINTVKMFFNSIIILIIGILFFEINIFPRLIFWSLILGGLYALAGILYLKGLNYGDAQKIIPFMQASLLVLIFFSSWLFFSENITIINLIGFFIIILGIYLVLSKKFKLPKIDKGVKYILFLLVVNTIYSLLVKKSLFDVEPINISFMMYFVSSIFLFLYVIFKRNSKSIFKMVNFKILPGSFFGALGTLLLYLALNLGEASKVYSIAGVEIIFVFFFSIFLLKEKFYCLDYLEL